MRPLRGRTWHKFIWLQTLNPFGILFANALSPGRVSKIQLTDAVVPTPKGSNVCSGMCEVYSDPEGVKCL